MRPLIIFYATLLLNAALFAVNLLIAVVSGSHAVLSQAIYTVTDLVGTGLILWGYYVSQRPPDHTHPFGHGKERFFWAFSASLVTFTTAGFVVLVTSFPQAVSPQPVTDIESALIVVGATLIASIAGIFVTLRELRYGSETLSSFLASPHQGLKTIFYQDLVSIVGSCVAFVGLAIVYQTHNYAWDGYSALIVGGLLIITGLVMAAETRELLVGKAISPKEAREILDIVERDPRVRRVRGLQSMMLGPDDVLLALKVNFQDGLNTDQIESTIDRLAYSMRKAHPSLRHVLIEPES